MSSSGGPGWVSQWFGAVLKFEVLDELRAVVGKNGVKRVRNPSKRNATIGGQTIAWAAPAKQIDSSDQLS
jgi:hypothetical protein